MLKACARCGKIHPFGQCSVPERERRVYVKKALTDIVRFRNSMVWVRKRNEIVERDNHLCKLCLYNGRINGKRLEVHHIVGLRQDFSMKLDDRNLITLCHGCHDLVENDKSYLGLLSRLATIPPSEII